MAQFYFAWAASSEVLFTDAHAREDEKVFSFELRHVEGDFPTLDITLVNPRVGLLDPARNRWAWFSVDDGSTIHPLFFGRLVGLPVDLHQELIQLKFIARPRDFVIQRQQLADSLKVRPFWDPIWFSDDNRDDPANVLEARASLWHIDRVTHAVTSSSIITGEDGLLDLGGNDIFYDSLRLSLGQAPARRARVVAQVSWEQKAFGEVDMSATLRQAFNNQGSGNGYLVYSYTGSGLQKAWPKAGVSIGGGWSVKEGSTVRLDGDRLPEEFIDGFPAGPFSRFGPYQDKANSPGVPVAGVNAPFAPWFAKPGQDTAKIWFPKWEMAITLKLQYDVMRRKSETLSFTLETDVQSVLTEEGDDELIQLNVSSSELANTIDPGGEMPIRDQRNRSYFPTDRGKQSIEYLLALARAHLLSRARMVRLDCEIPFFFGVTEQLSCRMNGRITDPRLPGGIATGKIAEYAFTGDGNTGKLGCTVGIMCCVGRGNAVMVTPGTPLYVEEGYVDSGYQAYEGQTIFAVDDELTYEDLSHVEPDDDGVDFKQMTPSRILDSEIVIQNPASLQEGVLTDGAFDQDALFSLINTIPTRVVMNLKAVTGGPFQTNYEPYVSRLYAPKGIDLSDYAQVFQPPRLVNGNTFGTLSLTLVLRPQTVINVNAFGSQVPGTGPHPSTVINVNTFGTLSILTFTDFSSTETRFDSTAYTMDSDSP